MPTSPQVVLRVVLRGLQVGAGSPHERACFLEREKGFEPSTSTLARGKTAFLAVTACDKYREIHPRA
jgi:hypothetical protein